MALLGCRYGIGRLHIKRLHIIGVHIMPSKYGLQDKLDGVTTRISASVKNQQTGAVYTGKIDFDWSGVTLADVLAFASADRRITWANTHRKNIAKYRGRKSVSVVVAAPGVRERIDRVFTDDDAVAFLSGITDAERDAIIERARNKKA